ncbi:MRN complex-interacting protein [Anopheles aquasalis]|uniref:MRN complex-interacting protein n=1 Tax=Anopheles aquasalis TaxID=42839 RepID=UPI00215A160B|nr:MRN complex-interacting protein [Anopheles aquasalis]
MPQELRVVRCFQCLKYQVDIVKKANKWACKMCGVKQSFTREFYRGTGKDCRSVMMALTERNITMDRQQEEIAQLVLEGVIQLPKPVARVDVDEKPATTQRSDETPNKWEPFVEKQEPDDSSDLLPLEPSDKGHSNSSFARERRNFVSKRMASLGRSKGGNFGNVSDAVDSQNTLAEVEHNKPTNAVERHLPFERNDTACHRQSTKKFVSTNSQPLFGFHRKENSRKVSTPASTGQVSNQFHHSSPGSLATAPAEPVGTRKLSKEPAIPLMNFAKRVRGKTSIDSNETHSPLTNGTTNSQAEGADGASKWTKYVPPSDDTEERGEDLFFRF